MTARRAEASAGRKEMGCFCVHGVQGDRRWFPARACPAPRLARTSYFRVELEHAHGNYAGDAGRSPDPTDAASLPEHRMTARERRSHAGDSGGAAGALRRALDRERGRGHASVRPRTRRAYVGEYVACSPDATTSRCSCTGSP